MNKTTVAVMLLLLSPLLFLTTADGSESATVLDLCITEVSPADEAVTLKNISSSRIDLGDYSLTDGEGTLKFTNGYSLDPGMSVTVSKEKGTDWFNSRDNVVTYPSASVTKSGSFILADSGDEVILKKGDNLVDSVCFGKSNGAEGWTGPAVQIKSGQFLLRTHGFDTDTNADWISTKPGWTNLEFQGGEGYDALVIPFSFPESRGEPIFSAIASAEFSVDISIYLLSSPEMISLLCLLESRGVEVRVLVEGRPLGVDISNEISLLRTLSDSGGEVRMINFSGSSGGRYTYVHNKYAVIDSDIVVITSENWTSGNLGDHGNRGWGAIIESSDYACYMEGVFENDFTTGWGDVCSFNDLYPDSKPFSSLPVAGTYPELQGGYVSKVRPVLSPDNSFGALREMIDDAEERVYVQQMDLGGSLSSVSGDTPVTWMSQASSEGADVKFILDASQSDAATHRTYVNLIASTTSVQAVTVNGGDGYSLIHNKGLVIDDCAWIGSVNWTDTSFGNNRESAVVIKSAEVSDYFAELFLKDFGVNIYTVEENGISIDAGLVQNGGRTLVRMSVDAPADRTYRWVVDGEEKPFTGTVMIFEAVPGSHYAEVTMVDTDIFDRVEFTVPEYQTEQGNPLQMYALICGILILALGVVVSVMRERRVSKMRRPRCQRSYSYPRKRTYSYRDSGRRRR